MRRLYALSILAIPLAALAAAVGLFYPAIYDDPDTLVHQARGGDLVTLLVGVPLLAAGVLAARRGSTLGHVVWLGALGYLAYTYIGYAVTSRFNELFLAYVALVGIAVWCLVLGLVASDPDAAGDALSAWRLRRATGWFFIACAALFALTWLAEIVPATLRGETPQSVIDAGTPTSYVHLLDLAIVLPAMAAVGMLLLRHRRWGELLAGVILVKIATLGLSILSMAAFQYVDGDLDPGLAGIFVVVTAASVVLAVDYARALQRGRHPVIAAGPAEPPRGAVPHPR